MTGDSTTNDVRNVKGCNRYEKAQPGMEQALIPLDMILGEDHVPECSPNGCYDDGEGDGCGSDEMKV